MVGAEALPGVLLGALGTTIAVLVLPSHGSGGSALRLSRRGFFSVYVRTRPFPGVPCREYSSALVLLYAS